MILKKKKIIFVIPSLQSGGAERVLTTLSNALIEHFNIIIIVLYNEPIFYKLDYRIKVIYCHDFYNAEQSLLQSINNHYKCIRLICNIIKNNNVDVLIGFMTTANIYAIIAGKLTGIKIIISERVHPKFSDVSRYWFILRRFIYSYTDYLVIQTEEIADYFEKFIKKNKLKIILNPLSPALANHRNLSTPKEKIILNVGRLDDQKNQDMLIRAFSKTDYLNWTLVLIGEGKNRNAYLKLIHDLKLSSHVELLGNVEDVWTYYNKASIFAFTSRYEGFPNALTEAMYFGLSCISTDCPSGPSELIIDGENGFLIEVEDEIMLAQKLNILMNDKELMEQLGSAAMMNTEKFNIEHIASQWRTLISNI